jgi:murein DD-endopeptidase MepM/ murein hydrolase activator NlpD
MAAQLRKRFSMRRSAAILLLAASLLGVLGMKFRWRTHAPNGAENQSLEGTWSGALGGGANKLRILLTISKSGESYSGTLNSVDQGALLPMSEIRLEGAKVHFELKAVGGVYDGELQDGAKKIAGTWIQTGVPAQPLNFERGAPAEKQSNAIPAPNPEKAPISPQLDVTVPIAPTVFRGGGKWHLVYELHAANVGSWDIKLTRLEVTPASGASTPGEKPLATFDAAYLATIAAQPGNRNATEPAKLGPGSFAIIYVWVTLERREDVPASVAHRISLRVGTYPQEINIETPATQVVTKSVPVIGSPLSGENWLAANGPSNTSVHRRAFIAVNGRGYISQRFAIDWLQLYPDGKSYSGDAKDNKNYRAYGAEVHAVADGVVTEVKDGIPQNVPGIDSRAVEITLETIGGNHVIMQIGDRLFAFYAHMQPGSLRVKVGDHVRRGQVLGVLGNSGNSTEPHLHFDLCDASSMLACEGMPYALAAFEVQGKGWGWKSSESKAAPEKREMEIPLEGDVVRFVQ